MPANVGSRQYSEKAYVLSRSFVRQALLHPPESLKSEIEQIYLKDGRLQSVISHAKRLIEKEDDQGEEDEGAARWDADAIGSLSVGAKLSLKVSRLSLWIENELTRNSELLLPLKRYGRITRPILLRSNYNAFHHAHITLYYQRVIVSIMYPASIVPNHTIPDRNFSGKDHCNAFAVLRRYNLTPFDRSDAGKGKQTRHL